MAGSLWIGSTAPIEPAAQRDKFTVVDQTNVVTHLLSRTSPLAGGTDVCVDPAKLSAQSASLCQVRVHYV